MNSIPTTSNLFPGQAAASSGRSSTPVADGQKSGDVNVKSGGKKNFTETAAGSASEKEPTSAAAEAPDVFAALTSIQPIAEVPVKASVEVTGEAGDFEVRQGKTGVEPVSYFLDGKQGVKFASYFSSLQDANGHGDASLTGGDEAVTESLVGGKKNGLPGAGLFQDVSAPSLESTNSEAAVDSVRGKAKGPRVPTFFETPENRNPGGTGKFGLDPHPKALGPQEVYYYDQPHGRAAPAEGFTANAANAPLAESFAGASVEVSQSRIRQSGEANTNTYSVRGVEAASTVDLEPSAEVVNSLDADSGDAPLVFNNERLNADTATFAQTIEPYQAADTSGADSRIQQSPVATGGEAGGSIAAAKSGTVTDTSKVFSGATIPDASPAKQVVAALKTAAPTDSSPVQTVTVELHPVELGKLSIRVEQTGDSLTAQIAASEPASIELLQQDKSILLETLEEMGFGDASLDIFHNGSGENEFQPFEERNLRGGSSQATAETDSKPTPSRVSPASGIDVIA